MPSLEEHFNELGPGAGSVLAATEELGMASSVTTFTESEFGRTFDSSTTAGSDSSPGNHPAGSPIRGPEDAGDSGRGSFHVDRSLRGNAGGLVRRRGGGYDGGAPEFAELRDAIADFLEVARQAVLNFQLP